MTGRKKSDALIRDIARLFVQYKLEDWEPLLFQLRNGGPAQVQIVNSIISLYNSIPSSRSKKTLKQADSEIQFSDARASILKTLQQALRNRTLLKEARDLRDAYFKSGGKAVLPKERMAAIRALLTYLDRLPDGAFADALQRIQERGGSSEEHLADEYARWFNLIHTNPTSATNDK